MKKHLELKIYGKVQGVSFRYYVHQNAGRLGISGFVKNQDDGSVYVEAEGEMVDLSNFLELCCKGPRMARIDKVEYKYNIELKEYAEFKVY